MSKCFRKILVPVDFTLNTDVALSKALDLATPHISTLQLLHITENGSGTAPSRTSGLRVEDPFKELSELVSRLQQRKDGIRLEIRIIHNKTIEPAVISYARETQPDLIVIGKTNHHSFFPFMNTVISANIAQETRCPVLTVNAGSLQKKMETIVMPVTGLLPSRKLELLAMLGSMMRLNIHVLTILNNNQQPDSHTASTLLHSMRQIRNRLQCSIHHSVIHSNNKAIATLRYAENVNADILLVNPETQTIISTWISKKDMTSEILPVSQVQVLSVQPT